MSYSFKGRVRYSEIGEDGCLTLPGIQNYYQDCCTFQSEEIGQGMEALEERQRAWVLSSWQIVVNRYPGLGGQLWHQRRHMVSKVFLECVTSL